MLLFKCLLLGYLFGIRSERLMHEVQVNVAYRWLLDLHWTGKVPDASTLSQNRYPRFAESDIYQSIFDEIVLLTMERGMMEGRVLYTDSTHLKTNANTGKRGFIRYERTCHRGCRSILENTPSLLANLLRRAAHLKPPPKMIPSRKIEGLSAI